MSKAKRTNTTQLGKWLPRDRDVKACELIVEEVRGLHAYGHLVYPDGRRRRTSLLLDTLERSWRQP